MTGLWCCGTLNHIEITLPIYVREELSHQKGSRVTLCHHYENNRQIDMSIEGPTPVDSRKGEEDETGSIESTVNPETVAALEKESQQLEDNLEQLGTYAHAIDDMDVATLQENQESLDMLGDKTRGAFDRLTKRLSEIDPTNALVWSSAVGVLWAVSNYIGTSHMAEYMSYLPDVLQTYFDSPDSAATLFSFITDNAGDAFTSPSMDNYAANMEAMQTMFDTEGQQAENAARVGAGMVNFGTAGAVGAASMGVGKLLQTWGKAKQRVFGK
jgi:hypothetical protein